MRYSFDLAATGRSQPRCGSCFLPACLPAEEMFGVGLGWGAMMAVCIDGLEEQDVDVLDVTDLSSEERYYLINRVLEDTNEQVLLCRDGDRLSLVRVS